MNDLTPFLNQLRDRVTISDIVRSYVRLTKKGHGYTGLCPFHSEKTASFTVDDNKGFYHCFGCGVSGDAIDFLMRKTGMGFLDTVDFLAESVGLSRPKSKASPEIYQQNDRLTACCEAAATWFEENLHLSIGYQAREYVISRGLNEATIKAFRLGYAPNKGLYEVLSQKGFNIQEMVDVGLVIQPEDGRKPFSRFRNRLMFPIQNRKGHIIAFGGRALGDDEPKYLNSPETSLFTKGSTLYAHHIAFKKTSAQSTYIVVEGYMDVITMHQAGFETAVAPLGTALTDEQIQLLWRQSENPILCFDGDHAGRRAAAKASLKVLPLLKPGHSLNFCFLPEGEDPDSYLKMYSKESFAILLRNPRQLVEVLWQTLLEDFDLKTPEGKAKSQQIIRKTCQEIKDPDIQKFYFSDLSSRFKENIYQKFTHQPHLYYQREKKNTQTLQVMRPSRNKIDIGHKILLVTLVNHPTLREDVEDKLLQIDFKNEKLKILSEKIISLSSENVPLEIARDLAECGNIDQTYVHAKFAKPEASLEEAREGWLDVWHRVHQQQLLSQEITEQVNKMKIDFQNAKWNRIKQIKQMLETGD